jgi:hypothetical protein
MTYDKRLPNRGAAGWLVLLTLFAGTTAMACSSDESSPNDGTTDDDLADDDTADDDADDDLADDDVADDDTDDDLADDDADDDLADDDADDDLADDDADDDLADDDADDDLADDDADDDLADDDADDDLADDAGADDDSPPDAGADDDADDDPTDDAGGTPEQDGGGPPADVWAECPTSETWIAEATWPLTLAVDAEAIYCATFNETRTLQEELASKAQLRFSPGSYALPEGAEVPAALPLCMRDVADTITTLTSGTVRTELTPQGETVRYSLSLGGVFDDAFDSTLQANIARTADPDADPAFVLDGKQPGMDEDAYQDVMVCQEQEYCFPSLLFTSCEYESGVPNLHRVELEGGDIEFELRLGDSFAGTEPGAYVRAEGSFGGQEFTQTNYFKLVYHPTHHHFERTFVVLFDNPIEGACGVEVTNLERFGNDIPDEAYTVDCELNRIDPVAVLGAELVLE